MSIHKKTIRKPTFFVPTKDTIFNWSIQYKTSNHLKKPSSNILWSFHSSSFIIDLKWPPLLQIDEWSNQGTDCKHSSKFKTRKKCFSFLFYIPSFFYTFFLKKKIPVPNRRNLFKNKISFDIQIYDVDDITDIHVIFKHRRSSLVLMICIEKEAL